MEAEAAPAPCSNAAQLPAEPTASGCQYYLGKHSRTRELCGKKVVQSYQFCSFHLMERKDDPTKQRVPCPLDPSHAIYQKDLQRHLTKCPSLRFKSIEVQPYFQKAVNMRSEATKPQKEEEKGEERKEESQKRRKLGEDNKASSSSSSKKTLLQRVAEEEPERLRDLIQRIQSANVKCYGNSNPSEWLPEEILMSASCENMVNLDERFRMKHLSQQSSIIAHLQRINVFPTDSSSLSPSSSSAPAPSSSSAPAPSSSSSSTSSSSRYPYLYLELGAGKGSLSYIMQCAARGKTDHVLLDRGNFRRMADMYQKHDLEATGLFSRLKVDLSDFYVGGLPTFVASEYSKPVEKIVAPDGSSIAAASSSVEIRSKEDKQKLMKEAKTLVIPREAVDSKEVEKMWPIVAVSKHLCGGATDMALRCICETKRVREVEKKEEEREDEEKEEEEKGSKREKDKTQTRQFASMLSAPQKIVEHADRAVDVPVIAIALCCHQLCSWNTYSASDFWQSVLGFNASDFDLVRTMSSWAVCGFERGLGKEEDEVSMSEEAKEEGRGDEVADAAQPFFGLSKQERITLGHQCKRLLDAGRIKYLQENGYDVRLTRFVAHGSSPENVLLLAWPRDKTPSIDPAVIRGGRMIL